VRATGGSCDETMGDQRGISGPAPGERPELPEAPVFRPTLLEFADPLAYISAIRHAAEPFGIARIVPPAGWAPPLALNLGSLRLAAVAQPVHQLQAALAATARAAFLADHARCMARLGRPLRKPPILAGRELDLHALFMAVQRRGGCTVVTEAKGWREIARLLQVCVCVCGC
jgi:[histone H3]-trimethyl-L-lysine4 demethylase